MTRAAPAKLLGLHGSRPSGPGALADVAIYDDDPADRARAVPRRRTRLQGRRSRRARRQGHPLPLRPRADRRSRAMIATSTGASRVITTRRYGLSRDLFKVPEHAIGLDHAFEDVACAGMTRQRRAHRRHLRRSLRHARHGAHHHRDNAQWARQAAVTLTGFATSVIGCGCEAGIDGELDPRETPDGRPGVRVLLFAMSSSRTAEAAAPIASANAC